MTIQIHDSHRPRSMMRRFSLSLGIWAILPGLILNVQVIADRPNILLITADDLGIQLSCYGDPIAQTPNIDALAKRSVQFEIAYVTQASCSPSRSSLLTGRYPHANGQYGLTNASAGFQLHQEELTRLLPNILKTQGYRTSIVGKLHVGPEEAFQFDSRQMRGFNNRNVGQQVEFAKEVFNASDEQPWFLMFNLFDPHVARDRLTDGTRGPQYFPNQRNGLPKRVLTASDVEAWPWQGIDAPPQKDKIAGYYNCVHRLDVAVKQLLEELESAEESDNTVVIFVGDHGPPFARGKTSCYESGLRVPFLLYWPGVSEAHVSQRLVSTADVYPTILDAAGINIPKNLHGKSLRPVVKRQTDVSWRKTLVAEFNYHGTAPFFPRRAITDGRFKLIRNLRSGELSAQTDIDGDRAFEIAMELPQENEFRMAMERLKDPPQWELYDLQNDPHELTDLGDDQEFANELARLQRALSEWQNETDDRFRRAGFVRDIDEKFRR